MTPGGPLPEVPDYGAAELAVFVAVVAWVAVSAVVGGARAAPEEERPEQTRRWVVGTALGIGAWLAFWWGLAAAGVWRGGDPWAFPPRLLGYFSGSILGAVGLALSPVGARLARGLSWTALAGFQVFRLPLEVVLHRWHTRGAIPVEMTWDGRNLDVMAALAAIGLVAWSWWVGERKVPVAAWWAFEALGLGMLVNIALTAFPATPGPFYAGEAVPFLMVAFDAPVTWIVPVCVAGAVAGHLVLARALWASDGPVAVRRSRD